MKCIVCSIIKDEQRFLKEWIDWNISIGFDALYLCEDINSSSHEEITKNYDNVFLFKYNDEMAKYGSFRQLAYYQWFTCNYKDTADWCAFIDIDEFIHIDDNKSIKELLQEYDEFNGLYLYWRFYGADGKIERTVGNVQDNYKHEKDFEKDNGWRFKSIANFSKQVQFITLHEVKGGVNTWKLQTNRIRTFHKAHIKHYFTKSWGDWCDRIFKRGGTVDGHRKINDFFIINDDMLPLKDSLLKYYEPKGEDYQKSVSISNEIMCAIVPKCACSTMLYLSAQYHKKDWFDNIVLDEYKNFDEYKPNLWMKVNNELMIDNDEAYKLHIEHGIKNVVVYRDPIDRLISAKHTLAKDASLDDFIKDVIEAFDKYTPYFINKHLVPQTMFYDVDKIDEFVEIHDLQNWLEKNGLEKIALNKRREEELEFDKSILEPYLAKLKEIYKADYELIKKLKNGLYV